MASSSKQIDDAPVVSLDGVRVDFDETTALAIDALSFVRNERVFVLGRSGSGKTTLARLLKGRLQPTSGSVRVLGLNPATPGPAGRRKIQRRIAMIDQEFHLLPRLSVVANVLHGCLGRTPAWTGLFGGYPAAEWEKAEAILAEVELDGLGNRRVDTLSGGQRQRTAIARALMQEAELILADEPVSNLDPELAEDALDLLVRCTERREVTLMVNLHQPRLAKRFATRVIGLHQGRVVFDGPPDELSADSEEFIYLGAQPSNETSEPDRTPHDHPATPMAQ
ncbi:MAG: ATP-binding cassette domain-containing protein [Candidatus Hydrogenedentes bacterium]|nr:ATP-binding cassette domain-containing protein [Candidatus Hydrogenedentota bacterium]